MVLRSAIHTDGGLYTNDLLSWFFRMVIQWRYAYLLYFYDMIWHGITNYNVYFKKKPIKKNLLLYKKDVSLSIIYENYYLSIDLCVKLLRSYLSILKYVLKTC